MLEQVKTIAVALVAAGCSTLAGESEDLLALVGGRLHRDPPSAPLEDSVVLIEGGRIRAVGPRASVEVPAEARVLDVRGKVVTAGFWNCHVHFTQKRWQEADSRSPSELEHDLAEMLTRFGFTAVIDTGSFPPTLALGERISRGEVRGPEILTMGTPVYPTAPDLEAARALGLDVMDVPAGMMEVADVDGAIAHVRRNLDSGADGVKVFAASWNPATGAFTALAPELLAAITSEATC